MGNESHLKKEIWKKALLISLNSKKQIREAEREFLSRNGKMALNLSLTKNFDENGSEKKMYFEESDQEAAQDVEDL